MDYDYLTKTKYQEVKEAIERVHYQHTVDAGMMGLLSDREALNEYEELLDLINSLSGLSEDEVRDLTDNINSKIDWIKNPRHSFYNEERITTEEEFKDAIEHIHYRHRYDDGIMGTLDAGDATYLYNVLLEVLERMKGLSDETKKSLRDAVKVKIGQVNIVEEEKIQEYREYKEKQTAAFELAKQRYKSLSLFEKIKLHRQKQTPKYQDVDFMSVEEIDNLYLRKGK